MAEAGSHKMDAFTGFDSRGGESNIGEINGKEIYKEKNGYKEGIQSCG